MNDLRDNLLQHRLPIKLYPFYILAFKNISHFAGFIFLKDSHSFSQVFLWLNLLTGFNNL